MCHSHYFSCKVGRTLAEGAAVKKQKVMARQIVHPKQSVYTKLLLTNF